ncbi:MAG: DNA primase [Candidatus Cloacimonetes bacterium]|nr:DNA primase [Candidatus Cloacimonadota bacterium]
MKKIFPLIFIAITISLFALEPHFMYDPAISPDGEDVCFVYLDKLWTVDWEGGTARCLTTVDHDVSAPQYSPDGKWIAYMTARDGYQCIYKIPADGGEAISVNVDDFSLCDWFPDSKSLLVTRYQEKYHNEYFRLYLDGKLEKIASFSDIFSSLNKTGDKIIFCRRGYPYRESYTGSANGDLWIYDLKSKEYVRLTETEYTERYPQFSMQNDRIYFGASDGKVFQLYQVDKLDFSTKKKLTSFDTWSLRDLDVAYKNDRIVFEHFDQIWRYDPDKKKASPIKIEIKSDIIADPQQELKCNNCGDVFDVSSDGKLLVFSWKYDLFAMPVEGGDVKQITFDQKGIEDIVIMDDNKTVIFTKIVKGSPQLYRFNIKDIAKVEKLKWSDGKYIEYLNNQSGRLMVAFSQDNERGQQIAIGDSLGNDLEILDMDEQYNYGVLEKEGRYFLYSQTNYSVWNREMKLYDREEDKIYPIETTTSWFSSPRWGKDGKSAFYSKAGNIYRLDLQPKDEYYYDEEDNWEAILKDEEKKDKDKKGKDKDKDEDEDKKLEDKDEDENELEIDFNGIDQRLTRIVNKEGYNYLVYLTEDMLYYINSLDEEQTLRKVKYNGEDDEEVHTLGTGIDKIVCQDKNWYFSKNGSVFKMPLNGKKPEKIDNKFTYEYDRQQLNTDVFDQVWRRFGRGFYDPDMHDLDWDRVYKKYVEYLKYAYEPHILGNIVDEMIGELNASHTGFYPRNDQNYPSVRQAKLGATFDFGEYPPKGVRFMKLYRHSSLAQNFDIKPGDILLSIDGKPVGENLPFTSLLLDKVNEKIELTIDVGDSIRTVEVKGINSSKNYNLWYDDWVAARRQKVDEMSDGRFAYSHIRGMDTSSYQKFEDELFGMNFDKEALILDIRFNGGGYTHDSILETLTKKQYGWSSSRRADAEKYPTPNAIWDKPIVLLIDEDSFSDAEIFPILFKHLKLGKVIGMPTSGSVIGTGHISFMDGSSMRMPSSGWFEMDYQNMEGKGAAPDILVPMSPEDYIQDNDLQLKRAVEELFKEIKS